MRFSRRKVLISGSLLSLGAVLGLGRVSQAAEGEFPFTLTDAEWRARLSPEAYHILREEGTEQRSSSPLNDEHRSGVFSCGGCDLPLFDAATKFDSNTGWPSFYEPLPNSVGEGPDYSYGMTRTEVWCRRCGGHLGHVFNDGPPPTGLRYCINGLSMRFEAAA